MHLVISQYCDRIWIVVPGCGLVMCFEEVAGAGRRRTQPARPVLRRRAPTPPHFHNHMAPPELEAAGAGVVAVGADGKRGARSTPAAEQPGLRRRCRRRRRRRGIGSRSLIFNFWAVGSDKWRGLPHPTTLLRKSFSFSFNRKKKPNLEGTDRTNRRVYVRV